MADKRDWKSEPISALGLSVRCQRCVLSKGAKTIGDLCAMAELELLEYRSFGETTLIEVREKLAELGLRFATIRRGDFDLWW